jgi:protein-disulfide isomerase
MNNEQGRNRRLQQLLAITVFAVALVGVLIIVSQSGDDSGDEPVEGLFEGISQNGTALGDADAPFTLIEFADLQCPFCADYDSDVLPTIVDEYVRTGNLRLEFRPLTFIGPDSEEAARFALALGEQDLLWNFVDLFYRNQGTENSGYVDTEFLTGLADQIPGADAELALSEQGSESVTKELDRARTEAREAGISSTPSFLIGPTGDQLQPLEISQLDADAFRQAIDAAIE